MVLIDPKVFKVIMSHNKQITQVLDSVITDLDLAYSQEELLDEGILDFLRKKGRAVSNAGRNTSIAAKETASNIKDTVVNKVHAAGEALGTDASIIRSGVLLVKGNEYLGIPGVKPGTDQATDIINQYVAKGYSPASDEQRKDASNKRIATVDEKDILGNLHGNVSELVNTLSNGIKNLKSELSNKAIITQSDINGLITPLFAPIKAITEYATQNNVAKNATSKAGQVAVKEQPVAEQPTQQSQTAPEQPAQVNNAQRATNLLPPPGPDNEGLQAGVDRLNSPEVRHRLSTAALSDEENAVNPRHRMAESRQYSNPLDIF